MQDMSLNSSAFSELSPFHLSHIQFSMQANARTRPCHTTGSQTHTTFGKTSELQKPRIRPYGFLNDADADRLCVRSESQSLKNEVCQASLQSIPSRSSASSTTFGLDAQLPTAIFETSHNNVDYNQQKSTMLCTSASQSIREAMRSIGSAQPDTFSAQLTRYNWYASPKDVIRIHQDSLTMTETR